MKRIDFSNLKFNIRCDINNNITYITCNSTINVNVVFYEWNLLYDELIVLYQTNSYFDYNELWYSTFRKLNDLKGLKIEIIYNGIKIKEEYFNFKTIYGNKIKKQVIVINSEIGMGDNLAATPTIKKISQIFNQKVILLTYIPSVFINNPYVEEIIQINKENKSSTINKFNNENYNIINLFNLFNTNWRLIDHKQICAYNAGFQLKPNELDMEFYPDTYIPIDGLPETFICINPSETEPERTWGVENWQKLINLIQEYIPVVAIGKNTYLDPYLVKTFSKIEIKNGLNLLGDPRQNTLSQAYHIIQKSKTFVTMNNGLYILALCNLDNHITEISNSWNTYFYRVRKGIENYNLSYVRGNCKIECISNPQISVEDIGNTGLLINNYCYLKKNKFECHPTPEQVYKSIMDNNLLNITNHIYHNDTLKRFNHIYQNIYGWFDFESIYSEMVNKFDSGSHFVEIGSFLGKSTSYMAVEIINSKKNIRFDCIDTWEGSKGCSDENLHIEIINKLDSNLYNEFLKNIEPVKDFINPIRGWSFEIVNQYKDNSIDFLFIDGAHDYKSIKKDIKDWYPKVKDNGVIAGHDYITSPGVVKAVNEFFGENNINIIGSSWIVDKYKFEEYMNIIKQKIKMIGENE